MIFKKAVGNEKIAELILNEIQFWVQIHGLKIQLLTRYVREVLGNIVGRVRVLINITKPLLRSTKVNANGCSSVVFFGYEKLPDFCFICRLLDHIERDCPTLFTNNPESSCEMRQYEP